MRAVWTIPVLLIALAAFAPARALGADPEHGGHAAKAADGAGEVGPGAHGGHGGEKNPFAQALDLTLWTSVVFVLLFLLLRAFAWKPILEGLHKREQAIHDAQEAARRDRDEATRLREQLQLEMSKASEQVRAMLDEARRDAQHTADEIAAKAKADLQAERQRMLREVDAYRDATRQELWNQMAQVATLVAAKAIGRQVDGGDHRRLVDESLHELGDALRRRL